MGQRVFLDVGAHTGETLVVALQPRWRFDRIWSFEPTSACLPQLQSLADERTTVEPFGWWSSDAELDVHDPGTLFGTVVEAPTWSSDTTERCRFVDAAAWMAEHITATDEVWLKINVEAAEVEILTRLLDSGEIGKVDHLLVHFDAGVGRGDEGRESVEIVRQRLADAGTSFRDARDVLFGRTTKAKTECWLGVTQGGLWSRLYYGTARKLAHRARRRVWTWRKARRSPLP